MAILASVVAAGPAVAQQPIPDSVAYREYRLTDAVLTRFADASKAILAANQRDKLPDMTIDDVETINGMAAFYDRVPVLHQALVQAGISSHDFVLFMTTAFQAGVGSWVVQRNGWKALPHNVSAENVRFYRDHQEELAKLNEELAAMRGEGGED